jgi:hypothetical protein
MRVSMLHAAIRMKNNDVEMPEEILRVINCVNFLGEPDPHRAAIQVESIHPSFRPDLYNGVHS